MTDLDPVTCFLRGNAELATAAALVAGASSGLLERLVDAVDPDPAASLGLHPEAVGLLLDLLAASGWVMREEGGWTAAGWVRAATPARMTDWTHLGQLYTHTEGLLREGTTAPEAPPRYLPGVVERLGRMQEASGRVLAEALPPVRGRVLDVGAGSAVWGVALAGPGSHLHVIDAEQVLPAARARAERSGLGDRFTATAGSLFELDLAALSSERVVCANVLHLFRRERAVDAVARLARGVAPGGDLVIVDAWGGGAARRAAYALHLRLRQPEGTVHGLDTLLHAVGAAGLEVTHVVDLPAPMGLGAIRAVRR